MNIGKPRKYLRAYPSSYNGVGLRIQGLIVTPMGGEKLPARLCNLPDDIDKEIIGDSFLSFPQVFFSMSSLSDSAGRSDGNRGKACNKRLR